MLETFVSSKIRRALLEYILTYPTDRFYLRGLAKQLGLAVSPLRRELKRLERSGMLTTTPEANLLFYTVNPASPAFLELKRVGLGDSSDVPITPITPQKLPAAIGPEPRTARFWQSPLPGPILVGVTTAGLALLLLVASVSYLSWTSRRLLAQAARLSTVRKTEVTVVVPQSAASGAMRGGRWQIVPGGFGGFSSASPTHSNATQESY